MKWRKILCLALAITMLTACGKKETPSPTEPPTVERKALFTVENESNMWVRLTYDEKKPDVAFIQPDGTVIMGTELPQNSGDNWIKFYLQDAVTGDWEITWDKKTEENKIDFSYESYTFALAIDTVTIGKASSKSVPVNFTVASDVKGTFSYTVTALIEEENFEEIIYEDVGNLNSEISCNVPTDSLKDGGYKFRIDVKLKYGSEYVTDKKTIDSYILTVKREPKATEENSEIKFEITDFKILDYNENSVHISFSALSDMVGSFEYEITADGDTKTIIGSGVENANKNIEKTFLINDLTKDSDYSLIITAKFADGKEIILREKICDSKLIFTQIANTEKNIDTTES